MSDTEEMPAGGIGGPLCGPEPEAGEDCAATCRRNSPVFHLYYQVAGSARLNLSARAVKIESRCRPPPPTLPRGHGGGSAA
jgi:hypothetical protein